MATESRTQSGKSGRGKKRKRRVRIDWANVTIRVVPADPLPPAEEEARQRRLAEAMADALVGYCRRQQRELGPERAAELLWEEARQRQEYNQAHAEEIEARHELHDLLMWSGGYETKPGRPLSEAIPLNPEKFEELRRLRDRVLGTRGADSGAAERRAQASGSLDSR